MNTETETETETEAKPKRRAFKYVVVVDTNDGDTRIVLASHAYKFVSANPGHSLYLGNWTVTAKSYDLEQLRALCQLIGPEEIAPTVAKADYLFSYWPGNEHNKPTSPPTP